MEINFQVTVADAYQYVPHFVARIADDKIDVLAGSGFAAFQEFFYFFHHA